MKTTLRLKLIGLLWMLSIGPVFAQNPSALLRTTFTNPTPAFTDLFGVSVSAMGTDRVLIGSDGGLSAGLFSTNSAAAYLFSTSGALLQTFTIADPAAFGFGNPAVAVGEDHVLISAHSYGTTAQNGRAFLFSTNGMLQAIFTNPNTARVQAFGNSLASLGHDRVLIGGVENRRSGAPYLGAVYLFSTNGTLLCALTNPTPAIANSFGESVAAVGSDSVLIGATFANAGAVNSGVAYLFSTNGTLRHTFIDPSPAPGDRFGRSVAAVGSDRVIIAPSPTEGVPAAVPPISSAPMACCSPPSPIPLQKFTTISAGPWPQWAPAGC